MPKLEVVTDGTVKGLQIIMDGVDITNTMRLTDFSLSAYAYDEHISYSYSTVENYVNEENKEQGRIRKTFSYSNGGYTETEPKVLGVQDSTDKIGGRVLKDLSPQSKIQRLFKKKGG